MNRKKIKQTFSMSILSNNVLFLQNTCYLPTFLTRNSNRIEEISIQKDKVLKLIGMLDTEKAHGCDQISVATIRTCDISIAGPLYMIFEKSLRTGNYPSSWKKAYITPVHKKESRQSKKNYRPISLLPIFGKIFENCYLTTYMNI